MAQGWRIALAIRGGLVTIRTDDAGTYQLWISDAPVATGTRREMLVLMRPMDIGHTQSGIYFELDS